MIVRLGLFLFIFSALAQSQIRYITPPLTSIYYVTPPDANGDQLVVGKARDYGSLSSIPLPSEQGQLFADEKIELVAGQYFSQVYIPTARERQGDYSAFKGQLIDPLTNKPFPGNFIPPARLPDPWAFRVKYQAPTPTTQLLPQLVFGGGWYTALYFSNTKASAATITVKFYNPDGDPLPVPVAGVGPVYEHVVSIGPNATVIIEAPDAGDLRQGWASALLPAGVTGYGVFRQTVPDSARPPQEAVVPISPSDKKSAELIWDEVGFNTSVAIVNPSDAPTTLDVKVYKVDGTSIGTSTVTLPARGRVAYLLRELPGLAGVTSQRGIARLTVSAGTVAALGLRFAASAFTSIPVSYQ